MISTRLAPPDITATTRPDGTILLTSREPLGSYATSPLEWLHHWGVARPDQVMIAQRPAGRPHDDWERLTYGEAVRRVHSVAQWLIGIGLAPTQTIAALSANSIDHTIFMLACYAAHIPFAPISPAYSLVSTDFKRFGEVVAIADPALLFVDDADVHGRALQHLGPDVRLDAGANAPARVTSFAELLSTTSTDVVGGYIRNMDPDATAKILFTSGSTGSPKGVIQTHRMMCANQQSLAQCWPFVEDTPPVLLDWLPWTHVFGSNNNFNLVLRNGGSFYIDNGRPPDPAATLHNLQSLASDGVSPTIAFNVPAGYAALLPHLESDHSLAHAYFDQLQMVFYAGAALPADLWDRLIALAKATVGRSIPMTSSWGSTETAPACTAVHRIDTQRTAIGTPVPGVTVKLVPADDKVELRVKGPNITPGYVGRPDLTAAAFDDEGFYRMGDAGRLADPTDPNQGLLFDGRIAEDFKLTSGTWVSVGKTRVALLAALSPYALDALIAGHDRDDLRALVWLTPPARTRLADPATWVVLRDELSARLTEFNRESTGSSTRIAAIRVLPDVPSLDAGETTDKGYVNQRTALSRRASVVAVMYAQTSSLDVVTLEGAS